MTLRLYGKPIPGGFSAYSLSKVARLHGATVSPRLTKRQVTHVVCTQLSGAKERHALTDAPCFSKSKSLFLFVLFALSLLLPRSFLLLWSLLLSMWRCRSLSLSRLPPSVLSWLWFSWWWCLCFCCCFCCCWCCFCWLGGPIDW